MVELTAHDRVAITAIRANPERMNEAHRIAFDHMVSREFRGVEIPETSRATRRRIRRLGLPCRSRVINGTHGPIVYVRTLDRRVFEAARDAIFEAVADFSGAEIPLSSMTLRIPSIAISWTRAA